MADVHYLPLRGRDLPEAVMGGYADTAHPDFARTRAKARVYGTPTIVGYGWRWDHVCRWRGGVQIHSYPLESWRAAYDAALEHLKDCW